MHFDRDAPGGRGVQQFVAVGPVAAVETVHPLAERSSFAGIGPSGAKLLVRTRLGQRGLSRGANLHQLNGPASARKFFLQVVPLESGALVRVSQISARSASVPAIDFRAGRLEQEKRTQLVSRMTGVRTVEAPVRTADVAGAGRSASSNACAQPCLTVPLLRSTVGGCFEMEGPHQVERGFTQGHTVDTR